MKQARCTQPATQIKSGPLELSPRQTSNVCGGANPRPYKGPTAVVAPDAIDVCPNGLAPNPFTRSCS